MSWAGGRRLLIVLIVGAVIIAVMALISVATFYQAPSCMDRTQNQGEAGIDCGGPCSFLCTADQSTPIVRFTKAILSAPDRTDVIALIDNPNASAARRAPYKITLYAADHTILKTSTGAVDLPPGATVPVYIPNFYMGRGEGAQAFLTLDASRIQWFTLPHAPAKVLVSNPVLAGTTDRPRVTATLTNPLITSLSRVLVIAVIYDSASNVIGASQTLVSSIPGEGSAQATFTWNSAFPATPARIDVVPQVVLSP